MERSFNRRRLLKKKKKMGRRGRQFHLGLGVVQIWRHWVLRLNIAQSKTAVAMNFTVKQDLKRKVRAETSQNSIQSILVIRHLKIRPEKMQNRIKFVFFCILFGILFVIRPRISSLITRCDCNHPPKLLLISDVPSNHPPNFTEPSKPKH